jgi:hypothetical protein
LHLAEELFLKHIIQGKIDGGYISDGRAEKEK